MGAPSWAWVVAGVAASVTVSAYLGSRHRDALDSAEALHQAAEARSLEAAGQLVVAARTQDELRAEVDRLSAESADLARALSAARRAAPGARVTRVSSSSTGPLTAPSSMVDPSAKSAPGASYEVGCALRYGARAEIRVTQVELATQAGSHLIVGEASAWRLEPVPERLLSGTFAASLALAALTCEPEAQGWGAGPLVLGGVAAGRWAWAGGAQIVTPLLLRGHLQLGLGLVGGPLGVFAVGSLVVR